MKQDDTKQSKLFALKSFMKTKPGSHQVSFSVQNKLNANEIKKHLSKTLKSSSKNQINRGYEVKYNSKQKRTQNSLSPMQDVDHFKSISLILNQQNINLNQQKNYLLSQIKNLQEKDKKKKIEIKQLKRKFKLLQNDYLQLQKLNLQIKYQFQLLSSITKQSSKKNYFQFQPKVTKNDQLIRKMYNLQNQQESYLFKQSHKSYRNSIQLQQSFTYFDKSQKVKEKTISKTSIRLQQNKISSKEHFPLSLKNINKNIMVDQLFQTLQKKFEKLMAQYRQKMDQSIRKQYREVSKCINCVRKCLEEYYFEKEKTVLKYLNPNDQNRFDNMKFSQISQDASTSCVPSKQEQNQQNNNKLGLSFQKYMP